MEALSGSSSMLKNLGAPLSRNVGLDAGTGQYVLFIDGRCGYSA